MQLSRNLKNKDIILKKNNWSSIDMMTLSDFAWTGRMKVLRVPGTLSIAFYHACFFIESQICNARGLNLEDWGESIK